MSWGATRNESLQVKLTLNKSQVDKHREDIQIISGYPPTMIEGDKFVITYTFTASYYGDIERKFNAIIRLLNDHELVAKASLEELRGLKCLFAEMILAIERRMELVRERPDSQHPVP